jgi:hypothetical protein
LTYDPGYERKRADMGKAKKKIKAGKRSKTGKKAAGSKGKKKGLKLSLANLSPRRPRAVAEDGPDPDVTPALYKPIIMPDPEAAVEVLRGLAFLNDRATAAHERYLELKDKTKDAKEKWEGLAEEVQRKLRLATHGSDLPLFDAEERELDLKALETAKASAEEQPAEQPAEPVAGEDNATQG